MKEIFRVYKWFLFFSGVFSGVTGGLFFLGIFYTSGESLSGIIMFAFSFAFFALSLTWFINSFSRLLTINRYLLNEKPFLEWDYSQSQWEKWVRISKMLTRLHEKRPLLLLFSFLGFFILIILLSYKFYDLLLPILIFLIILIFFLIMDCVKSQMLLFGNLKIKGKLQLWDKGAIIGKTFCIWHGSGARIEKIEILNGLENMDIICINYSVQAKVRRNQHYFYFPVPENSGKISEDFFNPLKKK